MDSFRNQQTSDMATLFRSLRNAVYRLSHRKKKKSKKKGLANDEVDGPSAIASGETEKKMENEVTVELHNEAKKQEDAVVTGDEAHDSDVQTDESSGVSKNHKKKFKLKDRISEALTNPDFENCEPEICVKMLHLPTVKTMGLIKRKIRQSDKSWIQGFLEAEGLSVLLDCVDTLSSGRVSQLADALLLLEVVDCIKQVINSKLGMDYLVKEENDTKKLIKGKASYILCGLFTMGQSSSHDIELICTDFVLKSDHILIYKRSLKVHITSTLRRWVS